MQTSIVFLEEFLVILPCYLAVRLVEPSLVVLLVNGQRDWLRAAKWS